MRSVAQNTSFHRAGHQIVLPESKRTRLLFIRQNVSGNGAEFVAEREQDCIEVVNILSAFCFWVVRWLSKAVEAGIDSLGWPSYQEFTASSGSKRIEARR